MPEHRSLRTHAAGSAMDLDRVVLTLNELIAERRPAKLNSTWILRHAPACYRFIRKRIRNEVGAIDWDQVTYLLDFEHQRRWSPGTGRRHGARGHSEEVALILNRYRDKLYVFISAPECADRRLRDVISIALVRVAQGGNTLARKELTRLVGYTVDDWLDNHPFLSRWKGHEEELRENLEGCIRRYRYTGSFIQFLRKTLEYAARGIRPSMVLPPEDGVFRGSLKKR